MNKGLAYNIIQSHELWKGGAIFRRPFVKPLGRVQVGIIPQALQRAILSMASWHNVEAAGIFERVDNGTFSRNGRRAACLAPGTGISVGKPKPVLPPNYLGCDGLIRSGEFEWADGFAVVWQYCWSAVRTPV